mmetsp:Transcript_55099/g.139673  ORF Transcript_55099/g.139673 Transcript_55099/m.139673 type:complete len:206 (+) Transcript_55099:3-620(+)
MCDPVLRPRPYAANLLTERREHVVEATVSRHSRDGNFRCRRGGRGGRGGGWRQVCRRVLLSLLVFLPLILSRLLLQPPPLPSPSGPPPRDDAVVRVAAVVGGDTLRGYLWCRSRGRSCRHLASACEHVVVGTRCRRGAGRGFLATSNFGRLRGLGSSNSCCCCGSKGPTSGVYFGRNPQRAPGKAQHHHTSIFMQGAPSTAPLPI